MPGENERYQQQALQRAQSSQFREQRDKRGSLPAAKLKAEVLSLVNANKVVVLTGETGCGKTTQVNQCVCVCVSPPWQSHSAQKAAVMTVERGLSARAHSFNITPTATANSPPWMVRSRLKVAAALQCRAHMRLQSTHNVEARVRTS
jgi:HrpA-like RNA helicase